MRDNDKSEVMNHRCSRCNEATRTWDELTDEEREVAKRLPSSQDYSAKERQTMYRWCPRCWNESKDEGDTV